MTSYMQAPPAGEAKEDAPRVADRVYGAVGVLAVLLALFFLVRGGPRDTGAAPAANVPRLTILAPAAGAELAQPVVVEFDAGAALRLEPAGWGAGGRHVHIRAGERELMAGGTDVAPLGGTRYRWTLPALPPGEHVLRMTWSDERHRAMEAGASAPVRVRVR